MKQPSPLLLPLLRTRAQGDILTHLTLHADQPQSLTEIAAATGTSTPTVMREINRLQQAGLVHTETRGNLRQVTMLTDHPVFRPLADLLMVTFGPVAVLRDLLAQVPGVEQAFIYGSWAARYAEHSGPVPHDLDVIVIGDVDRETLHEVADRAERQLRREVNIRRYSAAAWDADTTPFKATVLSRPTVSLIGGESDE